MIMDILKTTGATDDPSEAPEAAAVAGERQTNAASSTSSSFWSSSPVTGSLTLLTLPDATLPDTAEPVALIKNENPSERQGRLDTTANHQLIVTSNNNNGLCLTLSAEEEEDSQLKSSISSNDGDNDDDDDGVREANLLSPNGADQLYTLELPTVPIVRDTNENHTNSPAEQTTIELRLLVRRREAGALIGKRGTNIKRLREKFRGSMFSIPDTGNGPERVVCVTTSEKSMELILDDLAQLLMEKSPENDDQIELKLLIHSSQAGSIIGMGGQSIKKLRNDSKAAIKIYELCCPLSNERVCAIKARPPVVVNTIKLIQSILNENPIKGTIKPYDALHFDLMLADKYGGFLPDDGGGLEPTSHHYAHYSQSTPIYNHLHGNRPRAPAMVAHPARQFNHATSLASVFKHCPLWRPSGVHDQHFLEMMDNESIAHHLERLEYFRQQAMDHQSIAAHLQQQQQHHHHHHQQQPAQNQMAGSSTPPQIHLQPNHQCQHHLYSHNHCRGHQRTMKQEPGLHCMNESKLAKSYNPSGPFAGATTNATARQAHLFRYHPYASQVAGPQALPYPPNCIRPTLRHHHQQPLVGGQVYAPAAGASLYAEHPIQNKQNEFCAPLQEVSDGSQHQLASAAERCRHIKPCSCILGPSPVESTRPNIDSPSQPVGLLANK